MNRNHNRNHNHSRVVRTESGALELVPARETKVQRLLRTCGARMTALYLRKREYTLDEALVLMFPSLTPEHRNRFNHPLN